MIDSTEMSVRLLEVVDTVVRADPSPPGFAGEVCLGEIHNGKTTWWHARFGTEAVIDSPDSPPESADVVVGLKNEGSQLDPKIVAASGDVDLFHKMLRRYFRRGSSVGLLTGFEWRSK